MLRLRTPAGETVTSRDGKLEVESATGRSVATACFELDYGGDGPSGRSRDSENCARRADLYRRLCIVGFASPVPVDCDGRSISGTYMGSDLSGSSYLLPVAVVPLELQGVPGLRFPLPNCRPPLFSTCQISMPAHVIPKKGLPEPVSGLVVVAVNQRREKNSDNVMEYCPAPRGRWEALWVQDGLIVHGQSGPLEGSFSVVMLMSAQGLKTDLSGLKLVRENALDERLKGFQGALELALSRLSNDTQAESVKVDHSAGFLSAVAAAGIMLTGFVFPVLTPPSLGLGLAIGNYSRHIYQRAARWESSLREDLKWLPERAMEGFRSLPQAPAGQTGISDPARRGG